MGRPRKAAEPTETLDEFIARIERENEYPITAATFPGEDRDYATGRCGFKVTDGAPSARLSSGETVK